MLTGGYTIVWAKRENGRQGEFGVRRGGEKGMRWMWEGQTEEEGFPDFEEFEGGECVGGGKVGAEGGEGFFAGWAV